MNLLKVAEKQLIFDWLHHAKKIKNYVLIHSDLQKI